MTRKLVLLVLLLSFFLQPTGRVSLCQASELNSQYVTLELQNMNILEVLKLLSKKSGLNIVAGKDVQGQVSIFLQDVPVREALRTILESQDLASIEENGIIKIMTGRTYFEKEGKPYFDKSITQFFKLKYANAQKISGQLTQLKTAQGRIIVDDDTNSLLVTDLPSAINRMSLLVENADKPQTTRTFHLKYVAVEEVEKVFTDFLKQSNGRLNVEERSNLVIVSDTPERMLAFEELVKKIDVQVPQVLIEAKILEVRLNDNYRQGINWQEIMFELRNSNIFTSSIPLTVSPPSGTTTLPSITVGKSSDDLNVIIELLQNIGKTNLLSSPRLTVLNNEEARLAVATRQPFVSQTVVQTTNSTNTADNVQFVDVGVTLKVLPRISHDDYIQLKISPEVSSSSESLDLQGVAQGSNTTFTRTTIPVVTTQELETTVFVKSGTTIVLGGLIQDTQTKSSSKVPVIGSVPLLGKAFQSKSHDFSKTELVIFLTPTISEPDMDAKEEEKYLDSNNEMKPFRTFADREYRLSYWDARRHIQFGELPYWENLRECKDEFCTDS